jgi:hypothetical protein
LTRVSINFAKRIFEEDGWPRQARPRRPYFAKHDSFLRYKPA